MPVGEPIFVQPFGFHVAYDPLSTDELQKLRDGLWRRHASGVEWNRYADGSGSGFRTGPDLLATIGLVERELARRAGTSAPSTLLVSASKGLDA